MIIRPKDAVRMFGVVIMCFCAVWVCTMFLNYNTDLGGIREQLTDPYEVSYYDAIAAGGRMTAAISGGALLITTAVMLVFYIKHYIDTHRPELGILKAMGYGNARIAKNFWIFGLGIFTGACAGFAAAFAMMPAFYRQNDTDGILPEVTPRFNPEFIVYMLILPFIAFALFSVLYAYFKLRQPPLELIRGKNLSAKQKAGKKSTGAKELPFLKELSKSTRRSRRSLVFFIGLSAFCFSSMVQMSISMNELSSGMMAAMILGIGLVLAFTTLFIAVTAVVRGNTKTIAMMKVFGYSERECGGAVLAGYRPVSYIGFAIGTAYQYGLIKMMVSVFYDSVAVIPEHNFDLPAFFITLALFILFYESVMKVYTVRLRRIPIKEVMEE